MSCPASESSNQRTNCGSGVLLERASEVEFIELRECSTQVRVAVVIVNFNSGDMLGRCIASVAQQTRRPDRIIVVDNNSHDLSLAGIEQSHARNPELIRLNENTGFAAGNNLAIKHVQDCEWVALLNPDAFPDKTWLECLMDEAAKHPEYDCFASRQVSAEDRNRLDGAGDVYHVSGMHWRRGFGATSTAAFMQPEEVFSACAATAMYRVDVLREVGGFDESFFCYAEDVDLGFRFRLKNHRCLYVPEAVVEHVGSASTGRHSDFSVYHAHRNLVWVYFKNMPWPLFWLYLPQHLLLNLISLAWFSLHGQARVILRAKWDALKGLPRILQERRKVQVGKRIGGWQLRRVMSKGLFKPYFKHSM